MPESKANRIRNVQKVIDDHQRITGGSEEMDFLVDHLTDIRHWAESKDISFDICVERSENLYYDEGGKG